MNLHLNTFKLTFYLFSLLILNQIAFAQIYEDAYENTKNKEKNEERFNPLKSSDNEFTKIGRTDSLINLNEDDASLPPDIINTSTDTSQIQISYLFTHDFEDFSKLSGLDLSYYWRNQDSPTSFWWGLSYSQAVGKWEGLSNNPGPNVKASKQAYGNFPFNDDSLLSINSYSIGFGYRFRLINHVIPFSSNIMEFSKAQFSYNQVTDDLYEDNYSGPGFNAEYLILNRNAANFYYGFKIHYSLSTVTRAAYQEEETRDRTIVLSYLALGLQIGIFF